MWKVFYISLLLTWNTCFVKQVKAFGKVRGIKALRHVYIKGIKSLISIL